MKKKKDPPVIQQLSAEGVYGVNGRIQSNFAVERGVQKMKWFRKLIRRLAKQSALAPRNRLEGRHGRQW